VETAKGKTREETINRLADRIDSFENYSQPHSRFIAELAGRLARRFALGQPDQDAITEAAMLHDIGLYAMSRTYNALPRPLNFEERLDLWRHPVIGEKKMVERDASRHAQLLVRWHHEWWNGSGYPDMLAFEDIPLGARILRAVELYASLLADRPYRAALDDNAALEALTSSAGIECDPYVVKALLDLIAELRAVVETEAIAHTAEPLIDVQPDPFPVSDAPITIPNGDPITPESAGAPEPVHDLSVPEDSTPSSSYPRPWGAELKAFVPWTPEREHTVEPQRRAFETENPIQSQSTEVENPIQIENPIQNHNPIQVENPIQNQAPIQVESPIQNQASIQVEPQISELKPMEAESKLVRSAIETLLATAKSPALVGNDLPRWRGWKGSRYNRKQLLGFQASVLRQLEFRSIAVPFWSEARLDWYLKTWGKLIFANDPRAWAGVVARANVEANEPLGEDLISRVLEDVYVPGIRLANPNVRRWFSETDAWWMDNLRRNIDLLDNPRERAQALTLGLQTGDYALSFDEQTLDLRRPLTAVFWRLAGRAFSGPAGQQYNRSFNQPAEDFIKQARADLLYLRAPSSHTDKGGAEARSDWREEWVAGSAGNSTAESTRTQTVPQSKQSYLASIDRLLRLAPQIKSWAVEYQEPGLATIQDIIELIKEYRPIKATYSKDVTEVAGGLRSYIIVGVSSPAR